MNRNRSVTWMAGLYDPNLSGKQTRMDTDT
jgi:hypothetical protein